RGARALLIDLRRRLVLLRERQVAREKRPVIWVRASAVNDDVLHTPIEYVAVRVGEAERDVDVELLRSRFVAEHAAVGEPLHRAVRVFDLRVVERPFLEI